MTRPTITPNQIRLIAVAEAANVCAPGERNADAHNVKCFTAAIRTAFRMSNKRRKK